MWEDLPALVRLLGDDDALRMARAAERSVDELERWLVDHDVDAWFTRAGHLTVATSPAQDGAWHELVAEAARVSGWPRAVRGAGRRGRACPVHLPGLPRRVLLQPASATLQPARLALGLRRELLRSRRPDLRGDPARCAFAAGPPVRVRDAGRRRHRRPRRARPRRVDGVAPAVPPRDRPARHVHRDHGAGARAARGDRLDRRGRARRLADRAALPPHDAGRPDRVRRRGRDGRRRHRPRTAPALRRAVDRQVG